MKISAIEKMYHGNRGQGQQIPLSKEYHALNQVYSELEEKLYSELNAYPALLALYEEVHNAYLEVQAELEECHYQSGFRFGLLMAVDAFTGD